MLEQKIYESKIKFDMSQLETAKKTETDGHQDKPEQEIEEVKNQKAEEDSSDDDIDLEPQEYIFLIDRSGSMYFRDGPITMAKNALKIFMHSLPEGSKFNICGFGKTHKFLFDKSVDYNEETLGTALEDIETYDNRSSSMGGTEILTPLKHIIE